MAPKHIARRSAALTLSACLAASALWGEKKPSPHGKSEPLFQTSHRCIACHNQISAPSGEDISIGFSWRPTMMANSSRDPYWQSGVRRETIDHPRVAAPPSRTSVPFATCPWRATNPKLAGEEGQIFSHLPFDPDKQSDALAADGVSCSVCHQISDQKLGTRDSFVGGFVIDAATPHDGRPDYGPYDVDTGHKRIMHSSAGFLPTEAKHIRKSELCATCHTLLTKALGPDGQVIGRAAGTGALPGMAPQRLCGNAELPALPHAGGRRRCSHHGRAGRAAPGSEPARVCGRELLHPTNAEPLSRRPRCEALPQELERPQNRGAPSIRSGEAIAFRV